MSRTASRHRRPWLAPRYDRGALAERYRRALVEAAEAQPRADQTALEAARAEPDLLAGPLRRLARLPLSKAEKKALLTRFPVLERSGDLLPSGGPGSPAEPPTLDPLPPPAPRALRPLRNPSKATLPGLGAGRPATKNALLVAVPPFAVAQALAPQRGEGEDRIAVHELPGGGLVLVVADGAGGMGGGAIAADALLAVVEQALGRPDFDPFDASAWCRVLRHADRVIEQDVAAGETTVVVVTVSGAGLVGASAGDSEAWLVGDQGIDDLTAMQRKRRLGSGRAEPVGFERPALRGVLLAGSDGLFKYAPAGELSELASRADASEAARLLVQRVRLPTGGLQDDVAVVLVRPSRPALNPG